MIPNYQNREIESSGVTASSVFGISLNDSAHIMTILRDTLYSDKVLAILREYSANAWDAHKMVGKGDVPIKVVLPTHMDPTLTIQDYGPGLSHDDVFNVYTQYGASTKRNSNSAVGQLGIGSKSGFAYSDSFTITSRHGGWCRTYVAVLDETEKGVCNLLDEHEMVNGSKDETGVTIQIPVKPEDIPEFLTKAETLFSFFVPRPNINIALPAETPVQMRLQNGVVYEESSSKGEWVAVMGCIPYRINLDQLNITSNTEDKSGVGTWVHKLSGALYFGIGEVHISASREELKYSKSTKLALLKKFNDLIDEFVGHTMAFITTDTFTNWDKRLRSQVLHRLDLPIPVTCKEFAKSYVDIQAELADFAKTFTLLSRDKSHPVRHLQATKETRIIFANDERKIDGFQLSYSDYLLERKDPLLTWEEVQQEFIEFVVKHKLEGIPTGWLLQQTWKPPFVKPKVTKIVDPKHVRKSFFLKDKHNGYYPYSAAWSITPSDRLATDQDVFVIIDGFTTKDMGFDIFHDYKHDKALAEFFKIEMPVIYGYKTTKKKPLTPKDCAGIYYPDWQKKLLDQICADPVVQNQVLTNEWQHVYKDRWGYGSSRIDLTELASKLGKQHPIVQTMAKACSSHKKWKKYKYERQQHIQRLSGHVYPKGKRSEAYLAVDKLYNQYPLLALNNIGLDALWGNSSVQWIEYVQLIDRVLPMGIVTFTPVGEDEKDEDDRDE
jgi:hypothetical protein